MAIKNPKAVTELSADEARAIVLSLRVVLELGDTSKPIGRDYLRSIAYLGDKGTQTLLESAFTR